MEHEEELEEELEEDLEGELGVQDGGTLVDVVLSLPW